MVFTVLPVGRDGTSTSPTDVDPATDPTLVATNPAGLATTQSPVDFSLISNSRKQELDAEARALIQRYGTVREPYPQVYPEAIPEEIAPYTELDYNDFKNILIDLKNNKAYTDLEKAYIWSQIADAKGPAEFPSGGFTQGAYRISLDGANPAVIDSHRARNTPNHTIVSFMDGYHGFGSPPTGAQGATVSLAYYAFPAADAHITQHEANEFGIVSRILGFNHGDANASRAVVRAFIAYRDAPEGHRFEAFANSWINGVVAK